MNKILYEASYIGSPKSFVGQITTGLELANNFYIYYLLVKRKNKCERGSQRVCSRIVCP